MQGSVAQARDLRRPYVARFLIIDDYPDTARTFAILVEVLGHEALPLTSTDALTKSLREYQPNVVVTDIQMPDMDGFEVARHIRATDPEILVVGFSGGVKIPLHPDVGLFDLCYEKPITMDDVEHIAKIADGRDAAKSDCREDME